MSAHTDYDRLFEQAGADFERAKQLSSKGGRLVSSSRTPFGRFAGKILLWQAEGLAAHAELLDEVSGPHVGLVDDLKAMEIANGVNQPSGEGE